MTIFNSVTVEPRKEFVEFVVHTDGVERRVSGEKICAEVL